MKAAVFHAAHQPLTIEEVEIEKPKRREVLLRTAFAGLCHSDLHFMEGLYPYPTPAVLGHEGAAVVEAVGEDVTYVKPGDHVITCLSVFCGECEYLHHRPHQSMRQHRGQTAPRRRAPLEVERRGSASSIQPLGFR